ncbi:hypothetical protein [Streptomyces sp. NBC_00872]|uniref:hypothetical protein n=1 Tax=Streptomyces sp. NBC_00872 TaxID=2903686 RepID=UPI00386FD6DC|nr:PH domain-containing protein [Streptomyces sp. NBC_00872]
MVLRRRSWPVLSWSAVLVFWGIYFLGLARNATRGGYHDLWLVLSVMCAATFLVRRVGSCRVMLSQKYMLIHNPLFIHSIPYSKVRAVQIGSAGGVEIELWTEGQIHPFAYTGSLLDLFFKTNEWAVAEIQKKVSAAPEEHDGELRRTVRRCWSSDIPLLLAIPAAAMAFLFS